MAPSEVPEVVLTLSSSTRIRGLAATARGLARPPGTRRDPIRDGMVFAGVFVAAYLVWMSVVVVPAGADAHAYWLAPLDDPYRSSTAGDAGAYLYSPAFLQAIAPLKLLPWTAFFTVVIVSMAALVIAAWGRWAAIVLLLAPVTLELANGNIDILLGMAAVAALRLPAVWPLLLLTKVTPGVGVLWFAVRREWRSLGIALGVTAAIVAVSFALGGPWAAWIEVLAHNSAATPPGWVVPVPLPVRVLIAAALVAWGARTDRPWTVVVAGMLALPSLGLASLSFLVALGLYRAPIERRIARAIRHRRTEPAGAGTPVGAAIDGR